MPRIAIEYTGAAQGAGVGRAIRSLTSELVARHPDFDYTLWLAGRSPIAHPVLPAVKLARTPLDPIWLTRLWHRLGVPLPVEWLSGACDVFFATDFALPPTRTPHTALFIHDLSYIRVPDAAAPPLKAYLDAVVPRSLRRAAQVVVNSEATRYDVAEYYDVPLDRITRVTFGAEAQFRPSIHPRSRLTALFPILERPYILAVGTVQPRKNYQRLIEALGLLRRAGIDIDLAIAGGKGWLDSPIFAAANHPEVVGHVHFLGHVADDLLPDLYTHARCFAMPSLYEGFGIPILEAMRAVRRSSRPICRPCPRPLAEPVCCATRTTPSRSLMPCNAPSPMRRGAPSTSHSVSSTSQATLGRRAQTIYGRCSTGCCARVLIDPTIV